MAGAAATDTSLLRCCDAAFPLRLGLRRGPVRLDERLDDSNHHRTEGHALNAFAGHPLGFGVDEFENVVGHDAVQAFTHGDSPPVWCLGLDWPLRCARPI